MNEKTLEDVICKYPELIEDKLSFKGRQVMVERKRVDVLFEDKFGQKLIVEIKKGAVRRGDVAQLLDYEGYFLSQDDPTVRVMLVGNRVPENLRRSLDHHGFEWKELSITKLTNFLGEIGDHDLLSCLTNEKPLAHGYKKVKQYSNGKQKRLFTVQAADLMSSSKNAVERAVGHIREEFLLEPSFHSFRCEAETKIKEMLEMRLGEMSPAEIIEFLDYLNTEYYKGRKELSRFGRQVTNNNKKFICEQPKEFNIWINALWKTEEDALNNVLKSFLEEKPIKYAGILLPTFVLYLRKPTAFNICSKGLEENMAKSFSHYESKGNSIYSLDRYVYYNRQVFDLLVEPFQLAPDEVDLVLSQLPKYLA
ncbi:DUF91 domain-containing protein [candidate division KSB1 bacterium]|nr:DUF91 domain-containing protein [candidate division KSB1 bacterium]